MALASSGVILPLPSDVTARIQSSATITSLNQVILGLVENSLDAQATKLEIDVDFFRGSCVVEDDGLGIPPSEFLPDGGLGKMHHTSKFNAPQDTVHGRNGAFLACLASLSVLTITSHHCLHRQTTSTTFHRSAPIATMTPAPVSHALKSPFHATRVTVRDLFGNMPVRVKQRATSMQDKAHHNRLWDELKRGLVSLLLAWLVPVSLRLKDIDDERTMLIREPQLPSHESGETILRTASQRQSATLINSLLRQAGLIHTDMADLWIPASASSRSISVKGVICLEPSPTKQAQFMSLGIRPLLFNEGRNELLEYVNKLFSLSNFGAVEQAVELDDTEVERRRKDRRFKSDRPALKEPRSGSKGVDRWPMFYLKVQLNDAKDASAYEKFSAKIDSSLHSITEVLDALVTSWLTANHFSIRRRGQKRKHGEESDKDNLSSGSTPSSPRAGPSDLSERYPSQPNSRNTVRKTSRPCSDLSKDLASNFSPKSPFSEFSRIKYSSGSISKGEVGNTAATSNLSTTPLRSGGLGCSSPNATGSPANDSAKAIPELLATWSTGSDNASETLLEDETFIWEDHFTRGKHQVNAHTGQAVIDKPEPRRPVSAPPIGRHCDLPFHKSITLRRAKSASQNQAPSTNRVDGSLRNWANPVFPITEQGICQIGLHLLNPDGVLENFLTERQIEKALSDASIEHACKLSKEGLRQAKVIAQVDKKFILVKMPNGDAEHEGGHGEVLVLVDQHATDERVKVEQLFGELCRINAGAQSFQSEFGFRSRITYTLLSPHLVFEVSTKEADLLREYAAYFADWGILYGIEPTATAENSTGKARVKVKTLPPVIAERSKLEPKVLISFLRSEIWKLSETGARTTMKTEPNSDGQEDYGNSEEHSWLKRIGYCPKEIVDMINSRACRSAVMFNDDLGREECEGLLRKVGKCAFPFQCAHGRPSMVPLISLGSIATDEREMMVGRESCFVDAYRRWRRT